ncbi:YhjD/YihY/BrkB family envelope integrity protein [Thermodesulfobacteriota bacterium]
MLDKIKELLDSILGAETLDLPGFRRRLLRVTQVLAATVIKFRRDNCNQLAAALSFKLVFSLVPLIVVSFSIFAFHPDLAGIKSKVQGFLFKHFIPTSSDLISGHIRDFLETASTVSIVGFAVFVLIAMMPTGVIRAISDSEISGPTSWPSKRFAPIVT